VLSLRWLFTLAPALGACGRVQFEALDARVDDAARDDAADGDAAGPDAALLDCTQTHPSAVFCDGFEDSGMGPWDYTVLEFGTATRTTARAYRGAASLAVTTDGSSNYKFARWGTFLPPATTGDLYIRSYQWLSSATTIVGQTSLLVTGNSTPPYPSTSFRLEPGKLVVQVETTGIFESPGAFPRDRWVCVQLHISIGATGSVSLHHDGTSVVESGPFDTRVTGGYSYLDVGVHYAMDTQPQVAMWIDEVVVDTVPVACN
jgi:hypothetical protein